MKNILRKLLFFGLAGFALSSCKVMYKPNMQNVPLFKEQGEFRATINTSNLQVAYAVSENIAVLANGYYQAPTWTLESGYSSAEFNTKRLFVEGAAGYFNNFEENAVVEVYGGAGFGNIRFDEVYTDLQDPANNHTNTLQASAIKAFIQPNIGITSENIDFGFSSRLVGLKFTSITSNYSLEDIYEAQLQDVIDESMFFFFEPALTFRAGYKWVKFHSQLQYSVKLNNQVLDYNPFGFNIGIHVNIASRYTE